MTKSPHPKRLGFTTWIDQWPDPAWGLMPLTHITGGVGADDIVASQKIQAHHCEVFHQPRAYLFYGRPAYRLPGEGAIRLEAACPFCFILDGDIAKNATDIFAFDTGAFAKRLYKHALTDEMNLDDFSLEKDVSRLNRLISRVFGTMGAYFDGDFSKVGSPDSGSEAWEFLPRAYLHLLTSPGRNEPDDRICSIEVAFAYDVPLFPASKAAIVPHTLWDGPKKAPWLLELDAKGIAVRPYLYVQGRHPEHYHALLEAAVRDLYKEWSLL